MSSRHVTDTQILIELKSSFAKIYQLVIRDNKCNAKAKRETLNLMYANFSLHFIQNV